MEQEIELEQENVIIYSGGGAVNSVNGYTGDVILTTSDLENTSDYQTGTEVDSAIATAIADKQDTLTAGNGITISDQNVIAADTTVLATQQNVRDEATARENADINLQGQIDAISAASDVTDVVGTYADLQAYDTQHLKDNDIIKVLQDESRNDETTYYRWSTTTQTFTLIGEEGPYYTKSATDTLLAGKQDTLTAGANIAIASDNTISATDTTYTAGSGLSLTNGAFSVDTTTIQPKLTAGSNITIDSNNEISATDTTYSNFVGTDGTAAGTAGLVPAPATTDAGKFLKADGTWDTAGGSSVNVVQTTGTSTTDVMSQNAVTSMVFADPGTNFKVAIGGGSSAGGVQGVAIGRNAAAQNTGATALGKGANATAQGAVAIGSDSTASTKGEVNVGTSTTTYGYNNSNYRLLTGLYDGQSAHDAATYGQLSTAILNGGTTAPTTATVGAVGTLYAYVGSGTGHLAICTDDTGGTYTWQTLV